MWTAHPPPKKKLVIDAPPSILYSQGQTIWWFYDDFHLGKFNVFPKRHLAIVARDVSVSRLLFVVAPLPMAHHWDPHSRRVHLSTSMATAVVENWDVAHLDRCLAWQLQANQEGLDHLSKSLAKHLSFMFLIHKAYVHVYIGICHVRIIFGLWFTFVFFHLFSF